MLVEVEILGIICLCVEKLVVVLFDVVMLLDVELVCFVVVGLFNDVVLGLVDWFDCDGYGYMLFKVEVCW